MATRKGGSHCPVPAGVRNPFAGMSRKQLAMCGVGASALGSYVLLKQFSEDLSRDFGLIWQVIKMKRHAGSLADTQWTAADLWDECARKHHDREAIVFIDSDESNTIRKTRYTWGEANQEANKVANWALAEGIAKRDVVALMMENRPEFLFVLFGLLKVGAVVSLINTNLTGKTLAHSFSVCNAKRFIVGSELKKSITSEIRQELGGRWFMLHNKEAIEAENVEGFTALGPLLASMSPGNDRTHKKAREGVLSMEDALFIYTSGTTGNPKAAKISHFRLGVSGHTFAYMLNITAEDRIYSVLPLYHSAALILAFGYCLETGATFVMRRKFSVSSFWSDINAHKVTVFQYIGELCRYLLAPPPSPLDQQHSVRLAVGNGLRPDIWAEFQKRFNIPQIGEFYAATEGNVGFLNAFNKVGAVGYIPPIFKWAVPLVIAKFDIETETPVRDPKTGFVIPCKAGEAGELLGGIDQDGSDPNRRFVGYTNKEATEKKILRDVLVKGDAYFRTGDLMRIEKDGFVYFVDRIGDTFRWKGENVATTQVAEVLTGFPGLQEVNVYGVKVGTLDGRAGMACIIPEGPLDMSKFYTYIMDQLPGYAAPLFLRLRESDNMGITGTFKHLKTDLVREGFDPAVITKDKLYYRDDRVRSFVPLDTALHQRIISNNNTARL